MPKSGADDHEGRDAGVQSVVRALSIIETLAEDDEGYRLSDLAIRTGLSTSTVHRLLATLESRRFLQFDRTESKWHVGARSFAVGATFVRRRNFTAQAIPYLRKLRDLTRETANLAVPTLMGRGSIPDDHVLMAGMVGLQTRHRYGNATMLQSDFVLGIGNRWANRHTGSIETYTRPHLCACRYRTNSNRPRVQPRSWHRLRCQGGARIVRQLQASGGNPESSVSVRPGRLRARTASARCCAGATLTTSRSSRSASMRR
jgi:IclR helix-turn-helix domain/Thiamine pyrophosphate enzyme, central domain